MQGLKGTWAGQTFALSKSNESTGKKTRIRRSKEQRKGMVESFIHKHQKLNNGSFPSLSLTHREVGGSFYTVREIVREIIQENRVLGPAKWIPEEHNMDQLLEQNQLGSLSIEPQDPFFMSSERSHFVQDNDDDNKEKFVSISNGQVVNGSHVDLETQEPSEKTFADLSEFEVEKIVEDVEQMTAKVTHVTENGAANTAEITYITEEVTVKATDKAPDMETVPVTIPSKSLNGTLRDLSKSSEEIIQTAKVETGPVNGTLQPNDSVEVSSGICGLVNEAGLESVTDSLPENNISFAEKETTEILDHLPLNNSFVSNNNDPLVCNDIGVESTKNEILTPQTVEASRPTMTKVGRTQTDIGTKTLNSTGVSSGGGVITVPDTTTTKNKVVDTKRRASPKIGNNATLNRIKPESWEGTSKKGEAEANPVWAVLKSFIVAFMKFWSE